MAMARIHGIVFGKYSSALLTHKWKSFMKGQNELYLVKKYEKTLMDFKSKNIRFS